MIKLYITFSLHIRSSVIEAITIEEIEFSEVKWLSMHCHLVPLEEFCYAIMDHKSIERIFTTEIQ